MGFQTFNSYYRLDVMLVSPSAVFTHAKLFIKVRIMEHKNKHLLFGSWQINHHTHPLSNFGLCTRHLLLQRSNGCLHSRNLILLTQNVRQRANRRDLIFVDLAMALRIMVLDMLELCRLSERRYVPVQMAHPLVEVWVSRSNVADVAFEMLDVDRVEADNGGVEPNICLGDGWRGEKVWRA